MSARLLGLVAVVLVAIVLGCSSSAEPAQMATPDVGGAGADAGADAGEPVEGLLARYLTGTFDSADQAASDRAYFDIHLTVCAVDAPSVGTRVLYVEQARADTLSSPYRQRLYVIEPRGATHAVSRVLELKAPAKARGLCEDPARLVLSAADVEERVGCAVELAWDGATFAGGTVGEACASDLSGATYATSEVVLDAAKMTSWDRGWDARDAQVWGATKGPYVFVRRTPLD